MVSTYYMDNVTYIGKNTIKHTRGKFNNNSVFSTSIIVLLILIILGVLGYIVV